MRQPSESNPIRGGALRIARRLCATSFLVRTLILGLVALIVSGALHALAQPARHSSDEATEFVDSLVSGTATTDQVPTTFGSTMGYEPEEARIGLVNPSGGCSTPGYSGPDRFAEACQAHDLGYDVLRHAEQEGARLSASARLEIDWHFYVAMLDMCDTPQCSAKATAYFCAVSFNSIRQGYKAPHAEPTTPWAALAVGVVGLSALGSFPTVRSRAEEIYEMRRRETKRITALSR